MEDTLAPELTGLSITPDVVDISAGAASVDVHVSFSDALIGISSVSVQILSPSGNSVAGSNIWNLTQGDANSGTYSGILTIPQYSAAGNYSITIGLHDAAGNSRYIDNAEDLFADDLIVISSAPEDTLARPIHEPCGSSAAERSVMQV
jgi:hypothetical protein